MKKVKNGYAFTAVICNQGGSQEVGIKEEFKAILSGQIMNVNAVFCIGADYNPVKPAILKRQKELVPLSEQIGTGEDARAQFETFMRSNKAIYSVLRTTFLVCRFSGKFDMMAEKWSDDTVVSLYSVDGVSRGTTESCVVCSEVSTIKGVNTTVINPDLMSKMRDTILKYLAECAMDRELFISTRLGLD